MKSRLHRLEIRNFKAFREFALNLEGRHLLVYGANGAGKSSLYWALYTFLQSARKATPDVAKYFDPSHPLRLLNTYEEAEANPKPGEIVLTLRDTATQIDTTYPISQANHGTRQQPAILKGDLASDFITYRFFFGFSHFRNSEKFNLWPLFEKEILPFCVSTGGQVPSDCWNSIKSGVPNPSAYKGLAGTYAYDRFIADTNTFAGILPGIVGSISTEAQKFYDKHFSAGDPAPITLKLGVTTPPSYHFDSRTFTIPVIEFGIQVPGRDITRPQSFLNEAKLTQLALSVRFAASLVNLHDSDLKLLVLDDLLVSLDMSNRMKVVEILLSSTFANYQKIILTHDFGFFREFARTVGVRHADWMIVRLEGIPSTTITCKPEKTDLQKAEDYLHGHNLDEAAVCLRKVVEDTVVRYLKPEVVPTKDYVTLTNHLRAARNKLLEKLPTQLYYKILNETPTALRGHLIAVVDDDVDGIAGLSQGDRDTLKAQRGKLRTLLTNNQWMAIENAELIEEVLRTNERVLNAGAHVGQNPLYTAEVQKAVDLIGKLEKCLA
ncbi:MAG: AAA family ATPase [Chthoniobacter sp.]|uniref:AAA family ATPase n=1 Tax=Chthoniobacter sp. TaxID=2510640 RepID=UPI0032A2C47C